MNGKKRQATDLEAELLRLNALVRERRKQLARLEQCPNKDCACRLVWREQVEKNLKGQVGKIRRQVGAAPGTLARRKGKASSRAQASLAARVKPRKRGR
jgi:hypothetical protein